MHFGAALALCLLAGPAAADLSVRWLGVAGFTLTSGGTTIAEDPFLSRPGLLTTLFRPYVPDEAVLRHFIGPQSPAPELAHTAIYLVGHSHYDHLGDVAWLATRTQGCVVGSTTTAAIAHGYGLKPDRTIIAGPGAQFAVGDAFDVRVFASRHAKVWFGHVPLEGELAQPPEAPIHATSFVLGDARGYLVTDLASGVRVALLSSADCDPVALAALGQEVAPIDVLLVAVRGAAPDFARRLVETLRPRLVVPHHFDNLFVGIDDPAAGAPQDEAALAAFERQLRDAAAAAGIAIEIRRPKLFESFTVGPAGRP